MVNANKLTVLEFIMVKHTIWPYQLPETFGFAAPKRIATFDEMFSLCRK